MPDVFTRAKRSAVMSRIRSRGNRDTELALARLLRANGIRGWRRHGEVRVQNAERRMKKARRRNLQRSTGNPPLTVRPDFVFREVRLALFVDGCFWHGCPRHSNPKKWLRKSSMPLRPASAGGGRTGRAFWQAKLAANVARDRKVNRALRRAGWRVLRIWEHELEEGRRQSAEGRRTRLVARMRAALRQSNDRGRGRRTTPAI